MIWLIEKFKGDNSYDNLFEEVIKQGHEAHFLNVKNYFEDKLDYHHEKVLFQGSIQLAKKLKKDLNTCYPVAWLTESKYLCSNYYPLFGDILFNDKYAFVPFNELQRQKWNFYSWFGKEALIFVRPDSGEKTFTGGVVDLQYFDKEWNNLADKIDPNQLVVVSTPKNIVGEWRFVCDYEQNIIAQSTYIYNKQKTYIPTAPKEATDFCKEILSRKYIPDPMFTVDICEDTDGKYWLLEFNSFSSAGLYACELTKIVERASVLACLKNISM